MGLFQDKDMNYAISTQSSWNKHQGTSLEDYQGGSCRKVLNKGIVGDVASGILRSLENGSLSL